MRWLKRYGSFLCLIVIAISSSGTYSRTKTAQEMEQARVLAQEAEFKGFDRQIKAQGEQSKALQTELHFIKIELDELRRSREGLMKLFDLANGGPVN